MSGWVREDPENPEYSLYTEIDHLDMKGNFPARLMNMVIASESKKEFCLLYDHIKKKETK